uniref:Uncharacterized protein n=1 Tax=Musca domestica TaxID=7370 RepID=A0A1I8M458_MUSDO
MSFHKLILLSCIILPSLLYLEAVKIGISKHLETTTTTTTSTTPTAITTTEEANLAEDRETSTEISSISSELPPIATTEPEWPEFPPRKEVSPMKSTTTTTTTTTAPSTTTKKPKKSKATKSPTTTTTTIAPDTTNSTDIAGETSALSSQNVGQKSRYCFCDLTINGCDINCCCDPDCPAEALKVFKCLKETLNDFELHEGRFEDFKFQHGLPTCEEKDGWLCVFKTNLPTAVAMVGGDSGSFSDTSHYYKWPSLLREDVAPPNREFYMYGDPIKVLNMKTKDVQNFDLPSSLKPPYCQTMEPIKYLKSQKRTCLQHSENLEEIQLKLIDLHENFRVVKSPNFPENIYDSKQLRKFTGNITLRWCMARKCQAAHEEIRIFHNFTRIHEIVVDLWHRDVNGEASAVGNQESWFTYDIQFVNGSLKEIEKNVDSPRQIWKIKPSSGPYGYGLGKPIILGKYVAYNKSLPLTDENRVLDFFSQGNEGGGAINSLKIMQKHKGLCGGPGKSSQAESISFGVNFAKQCKIRMKNDTLDLEDPSKANFTSICLDLQNRINEQLFNGNLNATDITSLYISKLGKPQNHSHQWIQLNVFNTDFNQVFGQYLENSGTFVCRNILLSLAYEFHMGYVYLNTAPGQQHHRSVEHASLWLGERHDLEFSLDELIEVPLTMTVRFYDINEKAASASSLLWNYFITSLLCLVLVLYV